jgi:hypothetical protein
MRMDWPVGSPGFDLGQVWVQSAADILGWGALGFGLAVATVVLFGLLVGARVVCRRFWCGPAQREVEVSFVESGLPGFRRPVAVRSCSAFVPPADVRCRRACLDRDSRVRVPLAQALQERNL